MTLLDGETFTPVDNIDPNEFCTDDNSYFYIDVVEQPEPLKMESEELVSLQLVNVDPTITSLNNDFLRFCINLTDVNMSGLSHITTIGGNFMWNCEKMETINLAGLENVTHVGTYFIASCDDLISINLSNMSKLENVDTECLAENDKLETVDISGWVSLKNPEAGQYAILDYFLYNADNLADLYLPQINPHTFNTSPFGFLAGAVNAYLHAGSEEMRSLYMETEPWQNRMIVI